MEKSFPTATNTGIRTKRTPAVDIDVYDSVMATQLEVALRAYFPKQPLLVRFGNSPKRLIPFRCEVPFRKMAVLFKAPGDDKTIHKIEVLGDGQQFIADGVHPDTRKDYTWKDGDLLSVPRESLPLLDETIARRFIAQATKIMTAAGWVEHKPKNKANGKPGKASSTIYGRTALKDECAALAAMPKDSGRNDALNRAAFNMFQLVTSGDLTDSMVRAELFAAATACGLVADDGAAQVWATIESGARAGTRAAAHQRTRRTGRTSGSKERARIELRDVRNPVALARSVRTRKARPPGRTSGRRKGPGLLRYGSTGDTRFGMAMR